MSAEAVGSNMPPVVTLDDLTAMMAADEHHRYEMSPEGVLSVMPPPDFAHAVIANAFTAWLLSAGVPIDRFGQGVGLRIPGRAGGAGGRVPDLVVLREPQSSGGWLAAADVLLAVEIVSPGSRGIDLITKRSEYAGAGIPQYWIVEQDATQTVTMHRLDGEEYAVRASMPLAWVLNSGPGEYDLV